MRAHWCSSERGLVCVCVVVGTRTLPLRSMMRVSEACAMMWPPTGFFASATAKTPPPGSAVTCAARRVEGEGDGLGM